MQIIETYQAGKVTAKVYERENLRSFPFCRYAVLTERATPGGKWVKSKPISHVVYKTREEALKAGAEQIANVQANIAAAEAKKAQQKQAQQSLTASEYYKVGDVVYCSWGWEQTNIDFYRVTKVTNKQIEIAELYQESVEDSGQAHGMSDQRMPTDELRPDGETYRLTVRPGGALSKISSCQYPRKWDGQSKYCSWYG